VIVADDDPLARPLIKGALENPEHVVITHAANGRDAVALGAHHRPTSSHGRHHVRVHERQPPRA
jgi:CheY-like chemotaxis protein